MKIGLNNLIKSIFGSRHIDGNQSSNIRGDNNTVNQTIIVNTGEPASKRDLIAGRQPFVSEQNSISLAIEENEGDDLPEIKKILEYRKIANEGNGTTALKLLEALKSETNYSSGYVAFRLNFNIGIILQNIGELEASSKALRTAHAFYPESSKAQTANAFAEFLDGNSQLAFDEASRLSQISGDHTPLAACIMFHAAKKLRYEGEIVELDDELSTNPSVVSARLEYLRQKSTIEYRAALDSARKNYPDEDCISIIWALGELDDMKKNMAFMLGAKMPETFEERVSECAKIFYKDVENSINRSPPNLLSLPSQANNAAVALRLSGDVVQAINLIENVIEKFPTLSDDLIQIRASLLLQQDRDDEALELVEQSTDFPELQVMASELEAMRGNSSDAVRRINGVIEADITDELRNKALITKAQIGIKLADQNTADEALEEIIALTDAPPELVHLHSAYDRVFIVASSDGATAEEVVETETTSATDKNLLGSLKNRSEWDFVTLLNVADELFARRYFRECADILRDSVSFSKESPALSKLCDACIEGGLGTLAEEIRKQLSAKVRDSVFGIKFGVNVAYLNGEVAKAISLTRKLFEQNRCSIRSLEHYIQSLLRNNERGRIQRVVKNLSDSEMMGSIDDHRSYVNLLVYCGEIERARIYAYKIYCKNQNDHRTWLALSSSVLAFGNENGNKNKD